MEGAKFAKLCRDTKLLSRAFTPTDVDLFFAKARAACFGSILRCQTGPSVQIHVAIGTRMPAQSRTWVSVSTITKCLLLAGQEALW